MDKFEYKIKADEIKELIAQGEYEQAAEIADSIDWRRVKSVLMLCTVSDLYKICRRYEDSRDMLLLAYERHPGGRTIVYSLCELSIKMEEFLQAVEYYKEFVEIAPRDSGRYILQYKLYEAQDVSLEERIAVLEELKKRDYREKWAYELAYLYHRVGLATKCVEECDELFLWFGNGKYVIKALELKMLHAPLTAEQQYQYDNRFGEAEAAQNDNRTGDEAASEEAVPARVAGAQTPAEVQPQDDILTAATTRIPVEEIEIQVKTLEVGKYDTINLQEELAAGIQEYFGQTAEDAVTRSIVAPMLHSDTVDMPVDALDGAVDARQPEAGEEKDVPHSEVFFGETGEMDLAEKEISQLQDMTVGQVVEEIRTPEVQPPKEIANVLSMAADGQISFVLPEKDPVEKQITGQISINDIILEWERLKKENEEKRQEEVRQRVLQQTGPMFTEFEASVRDGLLEKLESGEVQAETLDEQLAELFEDKQTEEEQPAEIFAEEQTEEEQPAEIFAEEQVEEEQSAEILAEEQTEEEQPAEILAEEQVEEEQPVDGFAEESAESPDDIGEVEELTEIIEVTTENISEEDILEEDTVGAEEPTADGIVEVEDSNVEFLLTEEDEAEAVPAQTEDFSDEPAVKVAEDKKKEAPTGQNTPAENHESAREKQKIRNLTKEERELYGRYIQGRSTKEQIIKAVDGISMAAYTGNVIVTGDEGMDALGLAKNMIREVQMTDSNFSGKIAKISGETLNSRDIKQIVDDLNNGALIIQKAAQMNAESAGNLYKVLQQEHRGIVIAMEDNKKAMDRFLHKNGQLLSCFTSRVDIAALSNDALVAFARKYAREKEYSIDQMGLLALHTRIEDMQTSDHAVTILEVKEIVDEAIDHANRKTIGHFFDILFAKRYDDEDMVILKEKDFI